MKRVIVLSLLIAVQMQSSFAKNSFEFIQCTGTGAINGIEDIYLQSSDLTGQVCGYLTSKEKLYTCFNGDLNSEEMSILNIPAEYGSHELKISVNAKDRSYILGKYFVCEDKTKEHCELGKKELVAEERIQCSYGVLKH